MFQKKLNPPQSVNTKITILNKFANNEKKIFDDEIRNIV